jgi:hypothetical protein
MLLQSLVRSTDHKASAYVVFLTPLIRRPFSGPNIFLDSEIVVKSFGEMLCQQLEVFSFRLYLKIQACKWYLPPKMTSLKKVKLELLQLSSLENPHCLYSTVILFVQLLSLATDLTASGKH